MDKVCFQKLAARSYEEQVAVEVWTILVIFSATTGSSASFGCQDQETQTTAGIVTKTNVNQMSDNVLLRY